MVLNYTKVNYGSYLLGYPAAQFWKTIDKWAMIKQKILVSHVPS